MTGGVNNSHAPEEMGALKVLGLDQIPPLAPPTIWGPQAGDTGQCGPSFLAREGAGCNGSELTQGC